MRDRNSKAMLVWRYVTVAVLVCAFALSFGDCLERAGYGLGCWFAEDDPYYYVGTEYISMFGGTGLYLILVAALLLALNRRWGDICSGLAMVLPVLMALTTELIYEVMAEIGSAAYVYTWLGVAVTILECVCFVSIWAMVIVFWPLKNIPAEPPTEEQIKKQKRLRRIRNGLIIFDLVLLLLVIFRDHVVCFLQDLLWTFG